MSDLSTKLVSLGFNDKEAAIYIACLELGQATASRIAGKAKMKRTTAYNILPNLVKEGLVQKTIIKGTLYFYVDDTKDFLKFFQKKSSEAENVLAELKSIHTVIPNKPNITIYEGYNGFIKIYEDFVEQVHKGGTMYAYAGTANHLSYIPQDILEKYMRKRIAKGIRLKLICDSSQLSESMRIENDPSKLREVKIITEKNFKFDGETIIYGNRCATISYKDDFLGVIVESENMTNMQKAAFEALWNRL